MLEFARGESRRRRRAASFHWLGELPICVVILQEFLRGLTGSRAAAAAHSGRRAGGKEGEKRASGRAAEEEEEAAAAGQPQSRAALCRRAARSGAPTAAERADNSRERCAIGGRSGGAGCGAGADPGPIRGRGSAVDAFSGRRHSVAVSSLFLQQNRIELRNGRSTRVTEL